jgi:2-C-methyl-D-erythritol 4-phosphate cytidylyltransferase
VTAAVIIPAAGHGVRLGGGPPKALRNLAGQPLLLHAVRSVLGSAHVGRVVVAAPPDAIDEVGRLLSVMTDRALVVAGGDTRRASVAAGLATLPAAADVVLVHDAARPLVPSEVVDRVVEAVVAGAPAVVPVVPVMDTIKRVEGDAVVETVDRSALRAAQTPQGFRREVLVRAHAETTTDATDDAGLVEEIGLRVRSVDGADEALKITRPFDLFVAEAILAAR